MARTVTKVTHILVMQAILFMNEKLGFQKAGQPSSFTLISLELVEVPNFGNAITLRVILVGVGVGVFVGFRTQGL